MSVRERRAPASLWIAARELSAGARGFRVFLACLALGVWAIAASGSVSETFKAGLAREARALLGGDVEISLLQRSASPEERAEIAALGPATSRVLDTNAMARAGERRQLVDIRGVDDAYPLIGALQLAGGVSRTDAFALGEEGFGVAVAPGFLETFDVGLGDVVEIGAGRFEVRALIEAEPDQLGGGPGIWPRVLTSVAAFEAAGLSAQGALFRDSYRVVLPETEDLARWRGTLGEALEDRGFRVRDRESASDGLADALDMLRAFLAVVGLAALIAGGVGVAQATAAFLDSRRESIAALKALGADGGVIRSAYLVQIGLLAGVGVVIGLALGALSPLALTLALGDRLPLPAALGVYPGPLFAAGAQGLAAAFAFALPALGRARATPPAALFRSSPDDARAPWAERIAAGVAAFVFAGLATALSPRPLITLVLLGGALVAFGLLIGVARLVMAVARRLAPQARGFAAVGLSNLGGPGSIAPTAAPALGLGVALLTLVAVTQANLLRQIQETAPDSLPSVVFTQIPAGVGGAFDDALAAAGVAVADAERYRRAPWLAGRITHLNGAPIVREDVAPSERWVIDGEIGLSFTGAAPPEAEVTEGAWWPDPYSGPPLISIEGDAARGLGAQVGDRLSFLILGRPVEAEIANFRRIDWGGFGANFAVLFAPGALEAARPAEIALARTAPEVEAGLSAALAEPFPDVNIISIGEALAAAAALFAELAVAVNAAASVAIVAGALVMVGAFAAAARRREPEAALLKTLGATRFGVLGLYAAEFAAAGFLAAALGAALGVAGAWPIVTQVFEAQWAFPWAPVAGVTLLAAIAAAAGGASVGWRALSRPPARVLAAQ